MRVTSETVLVLVLIHLALCDDVVPSDPIIISPILASTSMGKDVKKAKEFSVLKVIATGNEAVEPSDVTEVNQPIYVQVSTCVIITILKGI